MSSRRRLTIFSISFVLAAIVNVSTASAQGGRARSRPSATRPAPSAQQPGPKRSTQPTRDADAYLAAQRSIKTAIAQLEEYLREAPDGERAEAARRQIEALRALTDTAEPRWVKLGPAGIIDTPEWRVVSVEPQIDRVRVTIEIRCAREDGKECRFRPFDQSPLVLVDTAGRLYRMLEAGPLPADVRPDQGYAGTRVLLSGGRLITVTADFAPLDRGAVAGRVHYRDGNEAQPAKFSLVRGVVEK